MVFDRAPYFEEIVGFHAKIGEFVRRTESLTGRDAQLGGG
jgi:hypothetical protein